MLKDIPPRMPVALGAVDDDRLVMLVGEIDPDWRELVAYGGPLPPQAVDALELGTELFPTGGYC